MVIALGAAAAIVAAATHTPPHPGPAFVQTTPSVRPSMETDAHLRRTTVPDAQPALAAEPRATSHRHAHRHHRRRRHTEPKPETSAAFAAATAAPFAALDLNRADAAHLARIPGIGDRLAQRIVAFRHLAGPFERIDELNDVAGMTERRIDAVAPYLVVH